MTLNQLVDEWTRGHTKTAIARELGCSDPTLRSKLNGTSELTFGEAEKLADVLGVSLATIAEAIRETNLSVVA